MGKKKVIENCVGTVSVSTRIQQVTPEAYNPVGIFVKAPGAFLVLAFLVAIMNAVGMKTRANKVVEGCDGCCAACSQSCTDKKEEKA